jgi:hypothetical protein
MGKPRKKDLPDLRRLVRSGAEIAVRATPKASRNALEQNAGELRARVTAVPEGGKANAAVQNLLAAALGIAPSDLVLIRGQTSRSKVFRIT